MSQSKKNYPLSIDKDLLESNYHRKQIEDIKHRYSAEELQIKKDKFFEVNSCKTGKEDLHKTIKTLVYSGLNSDELRNAIDTLSFAEIGATSYEILKKDHIRLLKEIRQGYEIVSKTIYLFFHFDEKIAVAYDDKGQFVYERPLNPNEMQGNILTLPRKIAN